MNKNKIGIKNIMVCKAIRLSLVELEKKLPFSKHLYTQTI